MVTWTRSMVVALKILVVQFIIYLGLGLVGSALGAVALVAPLATLSPEDLAEIAQDPNAAMSLVFGPTLAFVGVVILFSIIAAVLATAVLVKFVIDEAVRETRSIGQQLPPAPGP